MESHKAIAENVKRYLAARDAKRAAEVEMATARTKLTSLLNATYGEDWPTIIVGDVVMMWLDGEPVFDEYVKVS